MMFKGAILNIAGDKLGEDANLIVLIKFESASFNLTLNVLGSIFGFLFSIPMATNSR